jgi:hypothetical protein
MQWFLLMVATCAVVKYWQLALFILGCYAVYKLIEWADAAYRRHRQAQVARMRHLIDNADREHRLVQRGDTDGIYGDFPPPVPARGIGIWLCDKENDPAI